MENEIEYEKRNECYICGAPRRQLETKVTVEDTESGLGRFTILYCPGCRLGMTDPYPSEGTVGNLYRTRASGDFDKIQGSFVDKLKDYLGRRLIRSLSKYLKAPEARAILDFSTGNGRFALCAKRVYTKAQVDAADLQEETPAFLKGSGVRYIRQDKLESLGMRYDLIILRHVLEHTHDPVSILRRLSGMLSDDGRIYIEVPNLDSGTTKAFGSKSKIYYVPRHIYHFTAHSLSLVIGKSGLTAKIERNNLPIMGNMISVWTGFPKEKRIIQVLGAILHPVQLTIELTHRSSTSLNAKCAKISLS